MNSVDVNFLEHARLDILACILEPQLLIYVGLRDLAFAPLVDGAARRGKPKRNCYSSALLQERQSGEWGASIPRLRRRHREMKGQRGNGGGLAVLLTTMRQM